MMADVAFSSRTFPELPGGLVGHEMGYGILRRQLITDIGLHQGHGHGLYVPKIGADPRPAQFNTNADFAGKEGPLDVVGLHLLGSATGRLRPHELDHWIAQNAADLAGPGFFRLEKGVHRTNLRPQAHPAIGAGVLVDFDENPAGNPVMTPERLNPSHRTVGKTSLACYALVLVCLHTTSSFVLPVSFLADHAYGISHAYPNTPHFASRLVWSASSLDWRM
jgi:hypothetical protein